MKKVSIIVPIYNSEKTLKKCLDSIINQTYKNIEIICINDASTDNSVSIINKYKKKDPRIILINQPNNSGPTITKNTGIKNAKGDYLSFVDSDDYIDKNMIEEMINFAEKNNLDIVRCNYNNYINNSLITKEIPFDTSVLSTKEKEKLVDKLLSGEIPAYMPLLMINKKILNNHNILIGDMYYLEDLLFYIKILKLTDKIGIINKRFYNYINNNEGLTFSLTSDKIFKRINSLKIYNQEAKKITNKEYQKEIIDNRTIFLLIHFAYELYCVSKKNKQEIINLFLENNITKIIDSISFSNYDTFTKISYKLIKEKKYKLLFMWFNFAKIYIKAKRKSKRKL